MTKYHDIYKYVCDRIKPSERSIQRYIDELGHYYEVLVKMRLKMALKKEFTEFAYNVQSSVDYDTKLICALNVHKAQQTITNYQ